MTIERAHEINGLLCNVAFRDMGLKTTPIDGLAEISLEDMLEAGRIVEAENAAKEITTVCDPRMVAAIYVLHHYDAGRIVSLDRKVLMIWEGGAQ